MKENNYNNNEMKYDSNNNYILDMLLGELIFVIGFCFVYCVVEKNMNCGHYASIFSLIFCTIANLYGFYPYIVRQLKNKKDDNNVE